MAITVIYLLPKIQALYCVSQVVGLMGVLTGGCLDLLIQIMLDHTGPYKTIVDQTGHRLSRSKWFHRDPSRIVVYYTGPKRP